MLAYSRRPLARVLGRPETALSLLAVLVLAGGVRLQLLDVVCYHFLFWFLHPLPAMSARGRSRVAAYLAVIGLSTALAWTLSPFGARGSLLNPGSYVARFYAWSYVHVSSSFAVSAAHPGFITRWFRPHASVA